jgi:hypothetical protein
MARKTFTSYKYSDGTSTRDRIIRAMGTDATYYNGEQGYSQDMGGLAAGTIKDYLADMIYPTSVMIVVISKNVDLSAWVKWEIEYATSRQTRNGRQSQPNGIVMAIEDSLLNAQGRYTQNQTTRLIESQSSPSIVRVSGLLQNVSGWVEDAYQKAQARNG